MKSFHHFLESIWQFMPEASLSSEYHPAIEGGAFPIPFLQAQKQLIASFCHPEKTTSPQLARPARQLSSYLHGHSSLPTKDKALIALRSAHLCHAKHLIADIEAWALASGYAPPDAQMMASGHQAAGWSRHEKLLLSVTDDLYKHQRIHPLIWKALSQSYTSEQILDLIFCAAAFHLCVNPM